MKILTEGHRYELANFEDDGKVGQTLQFIEKWVFKDLKGTVWDLNTSAEEKAKYKDTDLVTLYNGTTNEEVLSVLINRMEYLNSKFPCRENSITITKLQEALMWLNKRTEDRKKRDVEGKAIA